jgi:hypothetical protein
MSLDKSSRPAATTRRKKIFRAYAGLDAQLAVYDPPIIKRLCMSMIVDAVQVRKELNLGTKVVRKIGERTVVTKHDASGRVADFVKHDVLGGGAGMNVDFTYGGPKLNRGSSAAAVSLLLRRRGHVRSSRAQRGKSTECRATSNPRPLAAAFSPLRGQQTDSRSGVSFRHAG